MPYYSYLLALGALFIMIKLTGDSSTPRGIRNNNPMNIRENKHSDFDWVGEHDKDIDKAFEEFISPEHGIRAGVRILNTYQRKYGLNTISGIIERWAPPSENNTESYIRSVSRRLGIGANEVISPAHIPELVKAIIYHENGKQPYSDEVIFNGVAMA